MPDILVTCRRRSDQRDFDITHATIRLRTFEVQVLYGSISPDPLQRFIPVATQQFRLKEYPDLRALAPDGISVDTWELALFLEGLTWDDIDTVEDVEWLIEEEEAAVS
jgi:hypothetical protein